MISSSIDPWYYDGEYSGHWLRSPDYYLVERYIKECEEACKRGLACWLPQHDPDSDGIPF